MARPDKLLPTRDAAEPALGDDMTTRDPAHGAKRKLAAESRQHAAADVREQLRRLEREVEELKREVARQFEPEPLPAGELGLVLCRVGDSSVAFLQDRVREVVAVPLLTPLPEAPFWVPGLLNLRGSLVPVIDVHARIVRQPRRIEVTDFVVITDVEEQPIGFLVQEILDLKRSESTRIEQPRDVPVAPYLMGTLHIDGAAIVVLNPVALTRLADLPEARDT